MTSGNSEMATVDRGKIYDAIMAGAVRFCADQWDVGVWEVRAAKGFPSDIWAPAIPVVAAELRDLAADDHIAVSGEGVVTIVPPVQPPQDGPGTPTPVSVGGPNATAQLRASLARFLLGSAPAIDNYADASELADEILAAGWRPPQPAEDVPEWQANARIEAARATSLAATTLADAVPCTPASRVNATAPR